MKRVLIFMVVFLAAQSAWAADYEYEVEGMEMGDTYAVRLRQIVDLATLKVPFTTRTETRSILRVSGSATERSRDTTKMATIMSWILTSL